MDRTTSDLLAEGYRRNIDELREKIKAQEAEIDELKAQVKKEHSDYLQMHHAFYSEAELSKARQQMVENVEKQLDESNRINDELRVALRKACSEWRCWVDDELSGADGYEQAKDEIRAVEAVALVEKPRCEKHNWQPDPTRGPGSYCKDCGEVWLPT